MLTESSNQEVTQLLYEQILSSGVQYLQNVQV